MSSSPRPVGSSISGRRWWWIAVAAAVLVAAGAVTVAVVRGGEDGNSGGALQQFRPVVVVGDALARFRQPQDDPAIGTAAPQLDGQSFDGTAVHLRPGRNTMVVFFGHWNAPSGDGLRFLVSHLAAAAEPPDYDILVISTQAKPDMSSFPPSDRLQEMADPFPYPVLADDEAGTAASALGFSTFPYVVFVGADGTVLLRFHATLDATFVDDIIPQVFAAPPATT